MYKQARKMGGKITGEKTQYELVDGGKEWWRDDRGETIALLPGELSIHRSILIK